MNLAPKLNTKIITGNIVLTKSQIPKVVTRSILPAVVIVRFVSVVINTTKIYDYTFDETYE